MVAERAHNRLNPAEREEFFEQIARLKLTLSDADSEAEFQAAEEQAPTPAPVPVDRERLKAMALSLTTSSAARSSETSSPDKSSADDHHSEDGSDTPQTRPNGTQPRHDEEPVSELQTTSQTAPELSIGDHDSTPGEAAAQDETTSKKRSNDPNQLRLSREVTEKLGRQPGGLDRAVPRRKPKRTVVAANNAPIQTATEPTAKTAEADRTAASTETVEGRQKLPKGWIIDDEGFVVPGPR
ncbi:MAG: hypothetical protein ACR2QF_12900 [Geminicoccaceae bacterium]